MDLVDNTGTSRDEYDTGANGNTVIHWLSDVKDNIWDICSGYCVVAEGVEGDGQQWNSIIGAQHQSDMRLCQNPLSRASAVSILRLYTSNGK